MNATKLEGGHTQVVLAIDVTKQPSAKIITGAECGELSIWSPDGAVVHKQIISENDVTSIVCSTRSTDIFYVSSGEKIFSFDLRQLGTTMKEYEFNEDEINQIVLNENETFLASAEDSGNVKVFNLSTEKVYKTLRKHSNICSTISFRPHRPWELLSGAYDQNLIQWDFAKSRSYCIINMQEVGVMPENLDSYLVNPPFIHSLSVSQSGDRLACGTENALVQVFDSSKKTIQYRTTLRRHTKGVAQVHFPKFSTDRFLLSGGNDGRLCLWDLENSADHGSTMKNGCSEGNASHAAVNSIQTPVWSQEHSDKINWLTSGVANGQNFFAVADNTSCPFIFPFPI